MTNSQNIRIELITEELNNIYKQLAEMYAETNPYKGITVQMGLTCGADPVRVENAWRNIESLEEKARAKLDELREVIEE